eukprot:TRINITY_DN9008_c0_g1_i1.p1 TRINITY_DN9008_c0_g1~~TRINITY_DN9008_c0_g1_i1.p1  ORF type:complete len:458 (-),score=105.39 TRINITY_DN9008_c0_g1_i1:51-1424(-)
MSGKRKAGAEQTLSLSIHANHNKALTDILMELGITEKNAGQIHKFHAYRKAVQTLKGHPEPITSGTQAMELPGIGKKIGKKIQEILDTGQLQRVQKDREEPRTKAINLLTRVAGVGPVAARKFVDDGITTIEQLKLVPGLTHQQKLGIKYFHDFEARIPRNEVTLLGKIVRDIVAEVDPAIVYDVCGSYRRGAADSGDIDVLITHPDFTTEKKDRKNYLGIMERVVGRLRSCGFLLDDISNGPVKYMGVCILPASVSVPPPSKPCADDTDSDTDSDTDVDSDTDSQATEDENEAEDITTKKARKQKNAETTPTDPVPKSAPKRSLSSFFPRVQSKKATPSPASSSSSTTSLSSSSMTPSSSSSSSSCSSAQHRPRRIDIKLLPYESYYPGLLHSTGSDEFNRQLRAIALTKGFTLSEYGISGVGSTGMKGELIPTESEQEVFEMLDVPYVPPEDRNI